MDWIKRVSLRNAFRGFEYREHDFFLVTLKFQRSFKFRRKYFTAESLKDSHFTKEHRFTYFSPHVNYHLKRDGVLGQSIFLYRNAKKFIFFYIHMKSITNNSMVGVVLVDFRDTPRVGYLEVDTLSE